jgi:hypothetical protein
LRRSIPTSTPRCSAARDLPFSITLVFHPSTAPITSGRWRRPGSAEYLELGDGANRRHRARFFSGDALRLKDLFELVGPRPGCEVLIDDRPIPYSRELWLPLVWFLLLD